jgi:predicted RNA-binding protein YlxR (DUF448 family)
MTTKRKHVPMRTCIACHQKRPKRELLRVVRQADGQLEVDARGKLPGRGAYLCPSQGCWDRALEQRKLARALKCEVSSAQVDALRGVVTALLIEAEVTETNVPASKGSSG